MDIHAMITWLIYLSKLFEGMSCCRILSLVIALISTYTATGQEFTRVVNYDVLKNILYGGAPLPAEEVFRINGFLPDIAEKVELAIYEKKQRGEPIERHVFNRPFNLAIDQFEFQVSPLHSDKLYVFQFRYFAAATPEQLRVLQLSLNSNLEAAVKANFQFRKNRIVSQQTSKQLLKTFNQVVLQGLRDFRLANGRVFEGFSTLCEEKIRQIERTNLRIARFNIASRSKNQSQKVQYAEKLIDELIGLLTSEVSQFLSPNMLIQIEEKTVITRTEKLPGHIPVNLGYSIVYFGGNFDNFNYSNTPYLGISLPLANKTFNRYLGDASLSIGLLLQNISNENQLYTGPLVGRPLYAALGYKLFNAVRVHAGGAILSEDHGNGNPVGLSLRPMAGLSLELNVWVGFGKRKK